MGIPITWVSLREFSNYAKIFESYYAKISLILFPDYLSDVLHQGENLEFAASKGKSLPRRRGLVTEWLVQRLCIACPNAVRIV